MIGAPIIHARFPLFISTVVICLLLTRCTLTDQQLKTGWWKYGAGYHLGDVVDFNEGFAIVGDTVLLNAQKVGIITQRRIGMFGDDNEIEITSLDKKQVGIYHQK